MASGFYRRIGDIPGLRSCAARLASTSSSPTSKTNDRLYPDPEKNKPAARQRRCSKPIQRPTLGS